MGECEGRGREVGRRSQESNVEKSTARREREGEKRTRGKMDKKPKCKRQRTVRKLLQGKEKKTKARSTIPLL